MKVDLFTTDGGQIGIDVPDTISGPGVVVWKGRFFKFDENAAMGPGVGAAYRETVGHVCAGSESAVAEKPAAVAEKPAVVAEKPAAVAEKPAVVAAAVESGAGKKSGKGSTKRRKFKGR